MNYGPFYVARPIVPRVEDFLELVDVAFTTRYLSNGGALNSKLQRRLADMLQAPYLSLVCNGTIALEVAARALNMTGKVITTPFTFPATVSALMWVGLDPVLVDIEHDYLTIDPECIEKALTADVSGIVGVHVYGNPCDVDAIGALANRAGIPVLYDGAHIFDGQYQGQPVVLSGDATTLSFHATKLFNTAEGGAVITRHAEVNERISLLQNFGFKSEDNIVEVGINGKMSEINAALGLANLNQLADERHRRKIAVSTYLDILDDCRNVKVVPHRPNSVDPNQYFTVRFPGSERTKLRDRVYTQLRDRGVYARRYFYPLLSDVPAIRARLKQESCHFPNAARAAAEILALPLHGGIEQKDAMTIAKMVREAADA